MKLICDEIGRDILIKMIFNAAVHRRQEFRCVFIMTAAAQTIGEIMDSDDARPRRKLFFLLIVIGNQLFDFLPQLDQQRRISFEDTAFEGRFASERQQIFDIPEGQLMGIDQLRNISENISDEWGFTGERSMFNAGRYDYDIARTQYN